MTQNVMTLTQSNFKKFIQDIERKYSKTVAMNTVVNLMYLVTVARCNDYLNELNSPCYVVRFTLHPITNKLIIETINDQFKGYRYTITFDKIHREPVKYN